MNNGLGHKGCGSGRSSPVVTLFLGERKATAFQRIIDGVVSCVAKDITYVRVRRNRQNAAAHDGTL